MAERIWAKRRMRKPVRKDGVEVEDVGEVFLPCISGEKDFCDC